MAHLKQEPFEENPSLISPQSMDSIDLASPASSILSSTPSPSVRWSNGQPKIPLTVSSLFNNEVASSSTMPIRCNLNDFGGGGDDKVCPSPNSCYYSQPIVSMTPAFEDQSHLRKPLQPQHQ